VDSHCGCVVTVVECLVVAEEMGTPKQQLVPELEPAVDGSFPATQVESPGGSETATAEELVDMVVGEMSKGIQEKQLLPEIPDTVEVTVAIVGSWKPKDNLKLTDEEKLVVLKVVNTDILFKDVGYVQKKSFENRIIKGEVFWTNGGGLCYIAWDDYTVELVGTLLQHKDKLVSCNVHCMLLLLLICYHEYN
jgi:hypothetical protein